MRKRPLCLFAAALLLFLWLIPKGVWLKQPDIPSGESVYLTGTVTKREQTEEKQVYYLKNCRCSQSASEFSVLAYTKKGQSYPIGCNLSLYGTIYQLNQADNPGQFDARDYYQSQGILYTFQSEQERAESKRYSRLREAAADFHEFLAGKIEKVYGERDAGILKAVLLGDKASLPDEERELYQKAGIAHLLAISGLHISLIGIGFYKLLRKAGMNFLEAGLLSGGLLLFYGMMTGFGISTIRAVAMFLVMIGADISGRTYDMASAMALAAIIVVIRNPLQLRQAGFLLSFGAVLGICAAYPILHDVFLAKHKLVQTLLFSLSISLVTAPLSIHFYYEYPLYSTLLNLIVIPCMPLVMGFGAAGMAAGMISPAAGAVIGIPAHLVLSLYEILGELFLKLPSSVITIGCEKEWQMIVYYLLLLICLLLLHYRKQKRFALLIPAALLIVTLRFRSGLYFTMLDVGQGDGLFLRLPDGTTCLIDGGSANVKNVGQYRLLPYLKYEGVETLDYAIFSHLDADHTNGMEELFGEIDIGMLLLPASASSEDRKKWCEMAEKEEISVETIGAGDTISEEQVEIRCLYPEKGRVYEDRNDGSAVLLLSFGEFRLLLTGDLGAAGERELLRGGELEAVDVWKVSHHGSNYSGTEEFLRKISPTLSLISAGKNNVYGHPGKELLRRLEQNGSRVYTTIESGAIIVHSDGKQYTIEEYR